MESSIYRRKSMSNISVTHFKSIYENVYFIYHIGKHLSYKILFELIKQFEIRVLISFYTRNLSLKNLKHLMCICMRYMYSHQVYLAAHMFRYSFSTFVFKAGMIFSNIWSRELQLVAFRSKHKDDRNF